MNEEPRTKNQEPRRSRLLLSTSGFAFALVFGGWILFGSWPCPERETIPWEPDAIVVLGGGDMVRVRESSRLAALYPDAPVLLTGDGGYLEKGLRESGINEPRLLIEREAKSTWENAKFSSPFFDSGNFKRVVLVTNWFHAPRSETVFRRVFRDCEFVTAWEPAPVPLTPWDRNSHRREKLAALYYLLRYGVNSF